MSLDDLKELNNNYYSLIMVWLRLNGRNDTGFDFRKPYIKSSLLHIYPAFIFLYGCVFVFGLLGNIGILIHICRRKLYRNPTYLLVGNLALSDAFKAGIVLPITLINMLLQNWIFGSFLCYVAPMVHYFPIHASMLTYVTIAIDRYRLIVYPIKSRLPTELCMIAVWVVAVAAVLPFAVYIKYFDLGLLLGSEFNGQGICSINIERHIEQYNRAIFVIMYCVPLLVIASLFIKISTEINNTDTSMTIRKKEENGDLGGGGCSSSSTTNEMVSYNSRVTWSSQNETKINTDVSNGSRNYSDVRSDDYDDEEVDMLKENRSQKYIIAMVILFAICWCPVNILTIITHFVYENDDNTGHYDITYLIITLFGFISTCINPVLFAFWRMPQSTENKILNYFKSSKPRGSSTSKQAMIDNSKEENVFLYKKVDP